jgi:hypothetical protein
MFKVPVLRSIAKKETEKQAKAGLAGLVRTAEERVRSHGEEES